MLVYVFFFKQKTAYEMRISDWSSDVCSSDLLGEQLHLNVGDDACDPKQAPAVANDFVSKGVVFVAGHFCSGSSIPASDVYIEEGILQISPASTNPAFIEGPAEKGVTTIFRTCGRDDQQGLRSEEHTSEL